MNVWPFFPSHSLGIAVVCVAVAAFTVSAAPLSTNWILIALASSVSVVGVPHGGLDHLTGRRLLRDRFSIPWSLLFFPSYLLVAGIVAGGWFWFPMITAIGFFLLSALHFGMEDDRTAWRNPILEYLSAAAVGGLIIWVPALTQSVRMTAILQSVVPSDIVSVPTVMWVTGWLGAVLVPVAVVAIVRDLVLGKLSRSVRNLCFILLFAVADPLVSFGIYFSGWHSVRGLQRLARTHHKSAIQLAASTAPLTICGILMAVVAMYFWSPNQNWSDASIRTLFVGLSALAVPHLLLHGPFSTWFASSSSQRNANRRELEALT